MVTLPGKNRIWTQPNKGTVSGSLASSFNIDPQTNLGKLMSTGMIQTTTQATETNMTSPPLGFRSFNGSIWTIAGARVYKTDMGEDDPKRPFEQDAITGTPTACVYGESDLEIFNDNLYVTTGGITGKLYKTNAVAWTDVEDLGSGQHMLCQYGERLYVTNGALEILSINTSDVLATSGNPYTIDFDTRHTTAADITFFRPASDRIWIGVGENRTGMRGVVYEWDGISNQANRAYELDSASPMSCVIKDDIPYITDSNGKLLVFNGGAFVEVSRFPNAGKHFAGASGTPNSPVYYNGMAVIGGRVNILLENTNVDGTFPENCPSGIWEFDPDMGLYHKYSLSYTPVGSTTITDWGQNIISRPGGLREMITGDSDAGANGSFLAGAEVFTTATVKDCGVWINDTLGTKQKFLYIVTPELEAQGISDTWQKMYLSYRKLLTSGDKIVAKYRTSKQDATVMTITWTSTTTFTTTDANMANYAVGDEVEIIRGKGGGMCSHITVIALNAGTYTVTVDETHTGATSGTATVRLQKWIKAGTITDQVSSFKEFPIGVDATWVQIKVCFLGTGANEFEKLSVVGVPQQKPV